MKFIFLVIFLCATVSFEWISCDINYISDMNETQSMDFLSQILDMDLERMDLTMTEKQTLKLKLEKFKTLKLPSCPDLAKNFTQYMVKLFNCKESFGFPDNLDTLPPDEYAEEACDVDTWNEKLECVLPPTQDLVLGILRCLSIGKHWSLTSGIYQPAQYFLVSTMPTILNSFRNFICANRQILTMQLEMQLNQRALKYIQIKKHANPESKEKEALSLGLCLLKDNPKLFDKKGRSYCDRVSSIDLSAISECFSERDVYADPKTHDTYKKIAKLVHFMFEKNEGPEKKVLLNTTWEEFCSEESPLSKIFNYHEEENVTKKKGSTVTRRVEGDDKIRATSLRTEL